VVSSPVGEAAGVGLPRDAIAPSASPGGMRIPDVAGGGNTAPTARAQPAASTVTTASADEQTNAEQALRPARERWYAEVWESPEMRACVQALEVWAQQPGDTIDPLTFALVDEDEDVRGRAEALYEHQLAREEAAAMAL